MKKEPETKKRERPQIHETEADRVRAFRDRQRKEHTRIDCYIDSHSSWRLTKLAQAWGCSRGKAIQRLLIEADERYNDILFPVTE